MPFHVVQHDQAAAAQNGTVTMSTQEVVMNIGKSCSKQEAL